MSIPGEGPSGWKRPQSISPAFSAASWSAVGDSFSSRQDVREHRRHGEARERDPQPARAAPGHGLHVRRHAEERGEDGLDALEERKARRRELHPAARAVQEPHPERGLQLRNLAA